MIVLYIIDQLMGKRILNVFRDINTLLLKLNAFIFIGFLLGMDNVSDLP